MGMTMEENKMEVLIVNCRQNTTIKSPSGNISPKAAIKFLGYYVQNNLKIEMTINALITRINQRVGRIWQFPNLPTKCKIMLYYAYVQSILASNSFSILPFLSKTQTTRVQRACNNAIRAIVTHKWNKNKLKPISISKTRKKLGIPSVVELSQRSIAFETWKSRLKLANVTNNQHPKHITRNSHLLKIPSEIGKNRWSIWPKLVKCWNDLPTEIKSCPDAKRAKLLIKKLYSTK